MNTSESVMENESAVTWRSKYAKRVKVPEKYYRQISDFILAQLSASGGETTLTELITNAEQNLVFPDSMNLHWCLLQVKKDMQTHNLIKISFGRGCVQTIKINPQGKLKLKAS